MSYIYLRVPRLDGYKTLTVNLLVLIACCAGLVWGWAGQSSIPVGDTALVLVAVQAALNALLRVVTRYPVPWRMPKIYAGWDLGEGNDFTAYTEYKDGELVAVSQTSEHFKTELNNYLSERSEQARMTKQYGRPASDLNLPALPEMPEDFNKDDETRH